MTVVDKNAARSRRRRRLPNAVGGRTHFHQVGLTTDEELALASRARVLRVSVPRLLVESAFRRTDVAPHTVLAVVDELFKLRGYLRALSNNINQIAKAANATGEVGAELSATLAAVQQATERLDQATMRMYS